MYHQMYSPCKKWLQLKIYKTECYIQIKQFNIYELNNLIL